MESRVLRADMRSNKPLMTASVPGPLTPLSHGLALKPLVAPSASPPRRPAEPGPALLFPFYLWVVHHR
jgi:hypothetical protein